MRLNQYLAHAGVCSRRKADELIQQGLITVNGSVVTEVGMQVAPGDKVACEGITVREEKKIYILLNKPRTVVTTASDEKGRTTVLDLVQLPKKVRLYPVGRLDYNTTGIVLLTNDGDMAQQLTHPKFEVEKRYHVTLDKALKPEAEKLLYEGVRLEDGFIKPDKVTPIENKPCEWIIVLHSGKNHIVRRLFLRLGRFVKKLDRVEYAGLTCRGLPRGAWRYLTPSEIKALETGSKATPKKQPLEHKTPTEKKTRARRAPATRTKTRDHKPAARTKTRDYEAPSRENSRDYKSSPRTKSRAYKPTAKSKSGGFKPSSKPKARSYKSTTGTKPRSYKPSARTKTHAAPKRVNTYQ